MSKKKASEQEKPPYDVLLSKSVLKNLMDYKEALINGSESPGPNLKIQLEKRLKGQDLSTITTEKFIEAMLSTKDIKAFAETEDLSASGNWNKKEVEILGGINIAINDLTIYGNGARNGEAISSTADVRKTHDKSFKGNILITQGALLENISLRGEKTPDYNRVVKRDEKGEIIKDENGKATIDQEKYNALVEERMLPLLSHANETAKQKGKNKRALITMPGIGCGQFAGEFQEEMPGHLDKAMKAMLEKHESKFSNIACVYYDPFKGENTSQDIEGIKYRVRPFTKPMPNHSQKSQLEHPSTYEEEKGEFDNCMLFKIVAGDHIGRAGNDFNTENSIRTDEGSSLSQTDFQRRMTGDEGHYAKDEQKFLPNNHNDWAESHRKKDPFYNVDGNVKITLENGQTFSLSEYERLQNAQKSSITVPDQKEINKETSIPVQETQEPLLSKNETQENSQNVKKSQQEIKPDTPPGQGESDKKENVINNQTSSQTQKKPENIGGSQSNKPANSPEKSAENETNSEKTEESQQQKAEGDRPEKPGEDKVPPQQETKKGLEKIIEIVSVFLKEIGSKNPALKALAALLDKVLYQAQEQKLTDKDLAEKYEQEQAPKDLMEAMKSNLPVKDKVYSLVGRAAKATNIPMLSNFCQNKLDEYAMQRAKQKDSVEKMKKRFTHPPASSIHTPQHPRNSGQSSGLGHSGSHHNNHGR